MKNIPAITEVAVTSVGRKTMKCYIAGPDTGWISVENGSNITLHVRRPKHDGVWSGEAHAVMSPHTAKMLVDDLASMLGLNVIANAATIARELKGEELEEHLYVTLADEFYDGLSQLIANTLKKAPPERRDDVLAKLGDMSSVYGSDYARYM